VIKKNSKKNIVEQQQNKDNDESIIIMGFHCSPSSCRSGMYNTGVYSAARWLCRGSFCTEVVVVIVTVANINVRTKIITFVSLNEQDKEQYSPARVWE